MEIGTIKALHVFIHEEQYVTAELELNLKGVNYSFGGPNTFRSGLHGGASCDAPCIGRFLFRCMEICGVDNLDLLKSHKVLVHVENEQVIAIANVAGDRWFNPKLEFKEMKLEKASSIHPNFI
ncbi:hypothetical protein [Dyadobacter sp. CY326]|uniref:hypothetical protein n=1 Tax=Dyadobacter sp. CY326 TaxID=2907300 RepID=UPI001F15D0FC|nr:hypothetical protein [Dyadobacter sp. CY326]MCE7065924.1 hypothetical protein [Dyadobacter sp. CY326]